MTMKEKAAMTGIPVKFTILITILAFSAPLLGGTIASFPPKKYMIGPEIKYSPDGRKIAFTAGDGKKYNSPHYLYIGSSAKGSFRQKFADTVSAYEWKNSSEIIYVNTKGDTVTVREGNVSSGTSRTVYSFRKKMSGSGYARSYEKFDIKAISPGGGFILVERDKGTCSLINIKTGREDVLSGFQIPYSGNPASTVVFSGDKKRVLLFNGRENSWTVYAVSGNSLMHIKKITSVNGIKPGSNYKFSHDGSSVAFTVEKCKGGCFHVPYIYNISSGNLTELKTIRGGQILRVAFDSSFNNAVTNDMHRKLRTYRLK